MPSRYALGDAFDLRCIGQGIFAFARFVAAGLCYIGVPPRLILFVCTIGCVLGSALTITLPNGRAPVALGILVFFFEAPIFPTLFAITLRGMGGRTRLVSTGLVMALCGGGIWPSVAYAIETHQSGNARVSMSVVPVLYGVCALYALMINASGTLRRWVDPFRSNHTPQYPTFSSLTAFRMEKGSQEQVETTPQTQNSGFSNRSTPVS